MTCDELNRTSFYGRALLRVEITVFYTLKLLK